MGFPGGSSGKESACNAGDPVRFLGQEDPLEREMATHSNILAWRIPCTDEPGRVQSMGLHRVGHDWATSLTHSLICLYSVKSNLVRWALILPCFTNETKAARGGIMTSSMSGASKWQSHDWSLDDSLWRGCFQSRQVVTRRWEDARGWGWGQTDGGNGVCAMLPKGRRECTVQRSEAVQSVWGNGCLHAGDARQWSLMSDEDSGLHSLKSEKSLNLQGRKGHMRSDCHVKRHRPG